MRYRKTLVAIAIAVTGGTAAAYAAETKFPERPIRFVHGSGAGTGPDIVARALGDRLAKVWSQRVVVDARPGAAGTISAELVSRAAPDGHTWMMLGTQLFVSTALYPDLKFDLAKDFVSISLIGTTPWVLVTNPQVPAKSVSELIQVAKTTPLRYGSNGAGGAEHLCGFLLTQLTGTQMLHVPYKSTGQALADTMAREVHLTFAVPSISLPLIQPGRLRGIGVTSRKRSEMAPDIPSISETVPGYEMLASYAIVAPRGIPPDVLARINAEVMKVLRDPEFAESLKGTGIAFGTGTRAELDNFRAQQTKLMAGLVKASGVELK